MNIYIPTAVLGGSDNFAADLGLEWYTWIFPFVLYEFKYDHVPFFFNSIDTGPSVYVQGDREVLLPNVKLHLTPQM